MMDQLGQFVTLRNYSRFLWDEGRRETWEETAERSLGFLFRDPRIPAKVAKKARQFLLNLDVFPSMRLVWTAGEAAERQNACIYNCSFLPIDALDSFSETLYLLMCGCGVGFSIEEEYINQLPTIKSQKNATPFKYCIEDSREGWMQALQFGIDTWYSGRDVYFDASQLRPMGAPLRTMGGRSSGGEVLLQLLSYARTKISRAGGRKLTPLECHDILCEIWDEQMRDCKSDGYHPRRGYANNSAIYHERPSQIDFMREWYQLAKSNNGERGIANLYAAQKNAPHRRRSKLIKGFNPCAEISARPREFCNVTTVTIRPGDDFEDLQDKVRTATWLGVIQSTMHNFPHLRPEWAQNCEEEHLLGVSFTGAMDNPGVLTDEVQRLLLATCLRTMRKACKTLEITESKACTCEKPSGTVSEVAGCSSGLHPRWSKFYLRNMQIEKNDPLFQCIADQGVPFRDLPGHEATHALVSFPVRSPDGAITRHDMTAMDQLEWYLSVTENWCEHNASCTVYVAEDEWIKVADWIYDHWDRVKGVSFLPKESPSYDWLPFEEITEEEYMRAEKAFPEIDFTRLRDYERSDQTTGAREYACVGGGCDA